jgi:hypothetical protein
VIGVHQTILTKEEGGNCFAACLASILEVPLVAVPNAAVLWAQGEVDEGWSLINDWLASLGLRIGSFDGDPDGWLPHGYWIAIVPSLKLPGETHAVVFQGRDFVWDPRADAERARTLDEVIAVDALFCLDPALLARALPLIREKAAEIAA